MSMKSQMRKFASENKGETFSATSLARELGWKKKKNKNFNSKTARRLAQKCDAIAERVERTMRGKVFPGFDITFI